MNNTVRPARNSQKMLRSIEGFIEVALLTVIYYLVWQNGYSDETFPQYLGYGKFVLMGVYALVLTFVFNNFDSFQFGYLRLTDLTLSQWLSLLMVNFITYFQLCLIANVMVSVVPMIALTALQGVVAFVLPYFYTHIYHAVYSVHRMIMIYGTDCAVGLKLKMDSRPDKYNIKKMISVDEGIDKICQEILKYDSVILNDVAAEIRNDILKFCYERGIRCYVTPKLSDIILRGSTEICLFDTPLLLVRGLGLTFAQRFMKRTLDILLCLIVAVVALPVMLIVAIAIKIEDGGPVFYRQERYTIGYKKFNILKFRSMIVDAEKEGKSIPATENDPRITKVGKVIRAMRIDELPQLLNILKGDMSIVGPRPERVEHVEKYSQEVKEFGYRLKVKGGLTGYAQIYGKYNTSAYDKLRLDLMYIENYNILLDIKLILLTLRIIFKKESTEGFDKVINPAQLNTEDEESKTATQ